MENRRLSADFSVMRNRPVLAGAWPSVWLGLAATRHAIKTGITHCAFDNTTAVSVKSARSLEKVLLRAIEKTQALGGSSNSSAWYELRTIGPLATCRKPISRALAPYSSNFPGVTYSTTGKWQRLGCK